jgi:hypothetical protein
MNRTNRHNRTERCSFRSNILGREALTERLEDRIALSTIYVYNTNDSGLGSLRQAVLNAATSEGDDTISFTGSAFSGLATINLYSSIRVNDQTGALTITGTGAEKLTISGRNMNKMFDVSTPLSISYLKLDSGNAGTGTTRGGAITNESKLTLDNVVISNCTAGYGGAISNNGMTNPSNSLSITNSRVYNCTGYSGGGFIDSTGNYGTVTITVSNTLIDNCISYDGGAIRNAIPGNGSNIGLPKLIIKESTIQNCQATNDGGTISNNGSLDITNSIFKYNNSGSRGGAITSFGQSRIATSTFLDNSTGKEGGALFLSGNVAVDRCTISRNLAGTGGGIFAWGVQGTLTQSTITSNSSREKDYTKAKGGGGIFNKVTPAEWGAQPFFSMSGVLLINNTSAGSPNDLYMDSSRNDMNSSFSIIGSMAGYNGTPILNGSQNQVSPVPINTGTIGQYGGSTPTIPILSGTSAIFSGNPSVIGTTDQRGIVYTSADIGAFASQRFITKTSGNNQSTGVNRNFQSPLQVKIIDSLGNPVSNLAISFVAPSIGASINPSTILNVMTNEQGIATSPAIVANTIAGSFAVNVTANGNVNDSFSLTNLAGAASAIIKTSGNNQSTAVNSAFNNLLQLKVTDAYGNPLANVPVSFNVPTNAASLLLASTTPVTTNALGIVSSPAMTANTIAGSYSVNVTANGNVSDSFSMTNLAGAASIIVKTSGNYQSTVVNTSFSNPLQLKVTDAYGNPVANAPVNFNAPSNGSSLTFASTSPVSTNSQGIATSPAITANTIAGSYSVNVTANGNVSDSFTFTNLAGAAAKFSITAGDKQSTTVNTSFASGLKVLVTDTFNNPVTNTPVTFTVPSSGASVVLAGSNVVNTNSTGNATLDSMTANKNAGSFTVLASVPNLQTLNFNLTNNPGAVASLVPVNGNNQSSVINGPFPSALQVKVLDAFGNAVPNVPVSFTSPTTGTTVSFVGGSNANSNNSGVATSSPMVANGLIGKYTVTASASGAPSVAFALTNVAPTLQSIVIQQGITGRSFVRYVDININDPATVTSIVNSLNTSAPRITLTNTGLTGKTKKAVTIKGLAKAIGNTVRIDFGTKGIGGNAATNTADGSYLISLDVDGNGSLETSQRFFRLLGDVNGDKVVDSKDTALVTANLNKGGMNQPGDTNGDGKVNATDVSYVRKAQRRRVTV